MTPRTKDLFHAISSFPILSISTGPPTEMNIAKVKDTRSGMRSTLDVIKSKMEEAEEQISELKDRVM